MKATFFSLLFIMASLLQTAFALEPSRYEQRMLYQEALELQKQDEWTEYRQLLPQLGDYPLNMYLEYQDISHRLWKNKPSEIKQFITKNADSPLANRLERKYLYSLARTKQWQAFLDFYPQEPKSTTLRCYHYQAKYELGEKELALKGAQALWLYGRSRPSACDILFEYFTSSGQFTEALIWQRMELAFAARKYPLLSYLQKMLPASSKKQGQLLLKTYQTPNELLNFGLYSDNNERVKSIVVLGIKRMAKKDLSQAKKAWNHYRKWLKLENQQRRSVEVALIRQAFLNQDDGDVAWADKMLNVWRDSKLLEWRIRIALKELDWEGVSAWIYRLPKEKQEKDLWRYWNARAAQELGQPSMAQARFVDIAANRSFYGFLAAEKLKLPYQLNEQKVAEIAPPKSLATLPAFIRIEELLLLDFTQKARTEWLHLIAGRSDEDLLELGQLALDRHWHHFSVLATIEAKAWDLLSMRFPKAQLNSFSQYADERQLELSYLYAIARQESALNPEAESPVGARGLMQLMPATAKATAKKIDFDYDNSEQLLDPDVNIRLGSAYISQLLKKYDGNRLLATAAYNAGPHRVKRWRNDEDGIRLPADVWVETIPYRETRGYVKNVLAYNLIYGHFLENESMGLLFEPKEQSLLY